MSKEVDIWVSLLSLCLGVGRLVLLCVGGGRGFDSFCGSGGPVGSGSGGCDILGRSGDSVSWIVMTSGPLQNIGNVGVALGNKVGVLNLWSRLFLIAEL